MARGNFPGLGGANNMQQMVKQAQRMQQRMADLQVELEAREIETTSGGGAVRVVMSGKKELKTLEIKPEAIDPSDAEMLQDMIIIAVNEAIRKVEEMTESEMGKITGGLSMPGLF